MNAVPRDDVPQEPEPMPDWRIDELKEKYNDPPERQRDPYVERGLNRRDFS